MEKTYNPALIQRTQRYMETHSISQNQFAAKVNLSSAALSSYLNQIYGKKESNQRSGTGRLGRSGQRPAGHPGVPAHAGGNGCPA